MSTQYSPPFVYETNDPEYEYLVNLSGSLIPIAKIIIIGQVIQGIADLELEDGSKIPLWGDYRGPPEGRGRLRHKPDPLRECSGRHLQK